MQKDFNNWHNLKTDINTLLKRPGYREREVWWVRIGLNIGAEEDGKGSNFARPVLVLRGFSSELFMGIPLSTTKKRSKFYFAFKLEGGESVALLSQVRAFDTSRLMGKIGVIDSKNFDDLQSSLTKLLRLK